MASILLVAVGGLVSCGGSDKPATGPEQVADDDDDDGKITLGDRGQSTRKSRVPTLDDDDDDDNPGLEVKGLKGTLSSYDIQAGVEPHAAAISACYSNNIKRRRYLGGDITFKFKVKRDGDVKHVQLSKSDLGAWDVEKCMLAVARTMKFARPKGGEAEFTLPLEFDATRSVFWLEEEAGLAQVGELKAELKTCASEAKTKKPRQVMVTLYVGRRGAVTSVGFASDAKQPIDDLWADCAETKIRAWVLADPLGKVTKIAFKWN